MNQHGEPELCPDPFTWEQWLAQRKNRVVREQRVVADGDKFFVSTVFVGRDQRYVGDGPPLLWETVVFDVGTDPTSEIDSERYASQAEACAGHDRIVAELSNL